MRARIVVKGFAFGSSARTLGIASPTPSIESLRVMLAAAAGLCGELMALHAPDVSQAFTRTPLTDEVVVVKLPLACTWKDGSPMYLRAHRALNGLRLGSMAWSKYFSSLVQEIGLTASTTEACLFVGKVWISKNKSVPVLLLMYVDDLLIAGCEAGQDVVMRTLEKHVKIRQTGHVDLKGGMLKFLGRNIARHGNQVDMWVDVGYLDEPLREFSLSRKDVGKVVSPPD